MFNISSYLDKCKTLLAGQEASKEYIQSIIKEICHIDIEKNIISIKNGAIYITAQPIIKNEIFLKKTLLLEKLKEKNITQIH